MQIKKIALILALTVTTVGAWAKLPAPSEEAAAKAAETAKVEGELLGKSQDRVAQKYISEQKAKGVIVKPPPPTPATTPVPATAPAK